jgi:hypothetical protein
MYDEGLLDRFKRFGGKRFGGKRFGGKRFGGKRFGGKRFGGKRFGGKRFRSFLECHVAEQDVPLQVVEALEQDEADSADVAGRKKKLFGWSCLRPVLNFVPRGEN